MEFATIQMGWMVYSRNVAWFRENQVRIRICFLFACTPDCQDPGTDGDKVTSTDENWLEQLAGITGWRVPKKIPEVCAAPRGRFLRQLSPKYSIRTFQATVCE